MSETERSPASTPKRRAAKAPPEPRTSANGFDLKARLRAREPMMAAFCPLASPDLVQLIAHAGFDLVIIDAEHGAITIADVALMVLAAHAAGIPAMVRVPEPTKDFVMRALDAGDLLRMLRDLVQQISAARQG